MSLPSSQPLFLCLFVPLSFSIFFSLFFRWFPYQIYSAISNTTTSSACILHLRSTLLATVSFPPGYDSHALALMENRSGFFQPKSIFHCQPLPPTRHHLTSSASLMLLSLLFTRTWASRTSPPLCSYFFLVLCLVYLLVQDIKNWAIFFFLTYFLFTILIVSIIFL